MRTITVEQTAAKRLIIKYPIIPTLVLFIVMFIIFIIVSPHNFQGDNIFLSAGNMWNIFESTAGYSIGAFAMTLILLVGCIDLSCEGVIALSAVVLGLCLETFHLSFGLSILITLGIGAACGVINSIIVIRFKVPSFLATISVSFIFVGLAYTFSHSKAILIQSNNQMLTNIFGSIGSGASFLGLPVLLWWTVFFLALYYILISRSKYGRWAQATGGNEYSAFSSGINVNMVRWVPFILMGVAAAFIGIIFCARLGAASPNYGSAYSLKFIIAAILGGTGFAGEGGNVLGTLLGSLVMGVLTNGLSIIGIDIYIQNVITGIVIVFAVVFSIYLQKQR
jgi:ribose transport system permease protein